MGISMRLYFKIVECYLCLWVENQTLVTLYTADTVFKKIVKLNHITILAVVYS